MDASSTKQTSEKRPPARRTPRRAWKAPVLQKKGSLATLVQITKRSGREDASGHFFI
jgi:hypothetical protein